MEHLPRVPLRYEHIASHARPTQNDVNGKLIFLQPQECQTTPK